MSDRPPHHLLPATQLLGLDTSNTFGDACIQATERAIKLSSGVTQTCYPSPTSRVRSSAGRPVRVGIDGRVLLFEPSMERGIGHYTLNHTRALLIHRPNWQFYLLLEERVVTPWVRKFLDSTNIQLALYSGPEFEQLDLFHIPDAMSIVNGYDDPFKLAGHLPVSVLMHDLIPLIMSSDHYDRWPTLQQVAYMRRLRAMKERENLVVLTNSECTRRDLIKYASVAGDRIAAVMGGLNETTSDKNIPPELVTHTLKKHKIEGPFFLHVGALDVHKNFQATLAAHIALQSSWQSKLVVVGSFGDPFKGRFDEIVKANGISNVIFTGYLERNELNALYSVAAGLVFPSKYEGFGFPALEAMANNCAVVASNSGSLPEIVGDAGLLVDPNSPTELTRAMHNLLSNTELRDNLRRKGLVQAQQFTWEKTAQKTLEAWEGVLGICAAERPINPTLEARS